MIESDKTGFAGNATSNDEAVGNGTNYSSTASPYKPSPHENISWDDATWILTSSFIIFTMQSGFGLLESGAVSVKNEVNIMVKNAVDVIFGGLTFWMFGFGLAFGRDNGSNGFCGYGHFFVDADDDDMGWVFSWFIFQLSFATTSTTIVSGAMAERTKLEAYITFSFINTLVYCFPAHWVWDDRGFLYKLGVIDVAGCGAVHLCGGVTGLVATLMLKPRKGRFERKTAPPMGCPTNALLGLFMLWWGWLGFNCGSTFGISNGKWKLAARSAVATVNASMAGGAVGLLLSYIFRKRKFIITDLVNGVLGALVSVTGICAIAHPWEGLVIGAIGATFVVASCPLLDWLKIDDPVGVVPVHFVGAVWGMISIGLFTQNDTIENITRNQRGLFRGGGFRLLGVQLLAVVCISAWSAAISFIQLKVIDLIIGLRVTPEEEALGADYVEHGIDTYITTTRSNTLSNGGATNVPVADYNMLARRRRSSFGLRRVFPSEGVCQPAQDDIESVPSVTRLTERQSQSPDPNDNAGFDPETLQNTSAVMTNVISKEDGGLGISGSVNKMLRIH